MFKNKKSLIRLLISISLFTILILTSLDEYIVPINGLYKGLIILFSGLISIYGYKLNTENSAI